MSLYWCVCVCMFPIDVEFMYGVCAICFLLTDPFGFLDTIGACPFSSSPQLLLDHQDCCC